MTTFALPLLLFLATAHLVSAGNVFVGCTNGNTAPDVVYLASDANDCGQYCGTQNLLYSYYRENGNINNCGCTDTGPNTADFVQGTDSDGNCPATAYNTHISMTSLTFNFCTGNLNDNDGQTLRTSQPTIESCFQQCVNYPQILFRTLGSSYDCYCGTDALNTYGPNTCDSGLFYYKHTAGTRAPENSQYVKRQLKARRLQELLKTQNKLCPGSLTPCSIGGDQSYGYECIDTSSELESCGGCIYGEFNKPSSTIGRNCDLAAGIARGGSACVQGQCVTSKCRRGWTLNVNATCVRE